MRQRCNNPKNPAYKNYGGRGIKVCKRWDDFLNFMYDMSYRPKGASIERKDNDGDYQPSNCKWATRKEQALNNRGNRRLSNGKTLKENAEESKIHPDALRARLDNGWDEKEALTKPTSDRKKIVEIDGKTYRGIREASRETGISLYLIRRNHEQPF